MAAKKTRVSNKTRHLCKTMVDVVTTVFEEKFECCGHKQKRQSWAKGDLVALLKTSNWVKLGQNDSYAELC